APDCPLPNGLAQAEFAAIIPLMGTEMAANVESESGPWRNYITKITALQRKIPDRFGVFPYLLDHGANDGTVLGELLGSYQQIGASDVQANAEMGRAARCRDLAQGIAQLLSDKRLTIFISHTKRAFPGGEEDTAALITMVREV